MAVNLSVESNLSYDVSVCRISHPVFLRPFLFVYPYLALLWKRGQTVVHNLLHLERNYLLMKQFLVIYILLLQLCVFVLCGCESWNIRRRKNSGWGRPRTGWGSFWHQTARKGGYKKMIKMRNYVIGISLQIVLWWPNQEGWVGGAYSTFRSNIA